VSLTVEQITSRLEAIEQDAQERQESGEKAAEEFYKVKRDFELEYAKAFVAADGAPMVKKQKALESLEVQHRELYMRLKEKEGAYEGWKAALRTLELRASIGQSLLKSQRELGG
jgi:hypothetical protein